MLRFDQVTGSLGTISEDNLMELVVDGNLSCAVMFKPKPSVLEVPKGDSPVNTNVMCILMGSSMTIETKLYATRLPLCSMETHKCINRGVPVLVSAFDHTVVVPMGVAAECHTARTLIDLPFSSCLGGPHTPRS